MTPAPLRSLVCLILLSSASSAEVRLPHVFGDHMVLQRDEPVWIFGQAAPGEAVQLEFAQQSLRGQADDAGHFRLQLAAMPASATSRQLRLSGPENTIELEDVLVGDVWLCSGQSNMVWSVDGADGAEEARAQARDARIRMFTGELVSTPEPQQDLNGQWLVANADTVGSFSAVAYYFGRELLGELDIPIGLLNVSWGGSTVEAWTTVGTLETLPAARELLETNAEFSRDTGLATDLFAGPEVDDADWESVQLPASYKEIGHDIDGVIWFRRHQTLPPEWRGRELRLEMDDIDDEDHTYAQGVLVGNTNGWDAARDYLVPAACTTGETLTLAVRVRDGSGPGGFRGAAQAMRIGPADDPLARLPLAGEWRCRVSSTGNPLPEQHRPGYLYNGMLHPLLDCGLRGLIWYQGENNAIREAAVDYYELFPAFVRDLRAQFQRPELPFILVQLPNFARNGDEFWRYPVVRDAQLRAFRSLPELGMAITIDIGQADNIHPRNKLEVGRRLARWALSRTYGRRELVPTGPILRAAHFEGQEVRVEFESWGSELQARGGAPLGGFELCGADEVFHPATARLADGVVLVRSVEVPAPIALRYAFVNDPADANLVNAQGLPASPFRTDDFDLR